MNDHTLRVYDSILGLLPGEENPTPLVRLTKVVPYRHTRVYAKLEWYNPFGAVKDRIAANLLDDADKRYSSALRKGPQLAGDRNRVLLLTSPTPLFDRKS